MEFFLKLFKKIYTSGDTGTQYINSKVHGQSYYHLGPEKDYDLLENINIQKTNDIESSEFVVCTGLYNDNDERPEDYKNIFEDFLKQNLEIVCVNPDEIVYRGQARIYCAGALGKYYEKLGSAQCKSSVMLAALKTPGITKIRAKKSNNYKSLVKQMTKG